MQSRPSTDQISAGCQRSLLIADDGTDAIAGIVAPLHEVSTGVACRSENQDALLPSHTGSSLVAVEHWNACDVGLV